MMEPVRTWKERLGDKYDLEGIVINDKDEPPYAIVDAMQMEINELRALLAEAICPDDEELASHVHIAAVFSVGKPNPDAEVLFQAAQRIRQLSNIATLYNELIMGVAKKHPGETRHETALRYILRCEEPSQLCGATDGTKKSDGKES